MLTIAVVDHGAEERNKIVNQLHQFLDITEEAVDFLPKINIRPVSRQELKFLAAPEVCIIGSKLVTTEIIEVGEIKRLLPKTAILVKTTPELASITVIEQLARFGVDDTFTDSTTAVEFIKKIVLLTRRKTSKQNGTLVVVDSGKGGMGVTSIAAALGECVSSFGKSCILIDFDFETQDLSRFLQVRPYVNETLQLLFDRSRPITEEFVSQCLVEVWEDNPKLKCMSPAIDTDGMYSASYRFCRSLVSVLEVLDTLCDVVIIDTGSLRGSALKVIYRVADQIIFLLSNDPAALYASSDRVTKLRSYLAPEAKLWLLDNKLLKNGLASEVVRSEFCRATGLSSCSWTTNGLKYCSRSALWPASGTTMFGLNSSRVKNLIVDLAVLCGLCESKKITNNYSKLIKNFSSWLFPQIRPNFGKHTSLFNKIYETENDRTKEKLLALPELTALSEVSETFTSHNPEHKSVKAHVNQYLPCRPAKIESYQAQVSR